jgi:hypothetical protein
LKGGPGTTGSGTVSCVSPWTVRGQGSCLGTNGSPITRWIGDALTEEEIRTQSLVTAMRRVIGRVHSRLKLRVIASEATSREAKYLGIKIGAAVLIRENTWLVNPEGPIQYGKSIYRGDRYQMDLEFSSWPQGHPRPRPA